MAASPLVVNGANAPPELAVDMEAAPVEKERATFASERASARKKVGKPIRKTVPRDLIRPGQGAGAGALMDWHGRDRSPQASAVTAR